MKRKGVNIGISIFLLIGFAFHYGRLFEIFSWNSSIIRTESISHYSNSEEYASCDYSQLNDQYWEERALEESKIRIDFSERYLYLNQRAKAELGENQDKYLSYKTEIETIPLFKIIYPDTACPGRSLHTQG